MNDEVSGQPAELAVTVGKELKRHNRMLVTAESCTGGWVAQVVTSVAGSSAWFERGFVTYSNAAKQELLGVRASTLENHGAVSEQAAREMAEGAVKASHATVALAVTGIAGPGGDTLDKPVGTVCFAWAGRHMKTHTCTEHLTGDRREVRQQAVVTALDGLLNYLAEYNS
jgi:nicotinamide-nucleotide amidase